MAQSVDRDRDGVLDAVRFPAFGGVSGVGGVGGVGGVVNREDKLHR